jgi:hypothetical protein
VIEATRVRRESATVFAKTCTKLLLDHGCHAGPFGSVSLKPLRHAPEYGRGYRYGTERVRWSPRATSTQLDIIPGNCYNSPLLFHSTHPVALPEPIRGIGLRR